jgi:hypothetical protein
MEKNPVGRPSNPQSITRVGKRFLPWLTRKDMEKLNKVSKSFETSTADAIRKLIRQFSLEERK